MDQKQNLPQALLNLIPIGLAFLMPVFFLPLTTEFFEFNKLTLVTVATIIMLILWAFKMFINKSVFVTRSNIDLAIFAVLGVVLLSSIFSVHKVSSVFGSQGRWFPSLSGIISLIAMYFVISSNVDSKKYIKFSVIGFIAGVTVSSIVAILSYYKIYLGSATFLTVQNFTTTGSSSLAATLAAVAVVVSIIFLLNEQNFLFKTILLIVGILNLSVSLLIGNEAAWSALLVGVLGVAMFSNIQQVKAAKTHLLIGVGMIAALLLLYIIPATRSVIIDPNYPTELKMSANDSWIIVSSTLRDAPLLGTGPSTFYLNFPRYRSLSMNEGELWNVRFDKPYSTVFNIIGNYGIIGLIVFGFFAFSIVKFLLSDKTVNENSGVVNAIKVSALAILASFIFTYETALASFTLFFMLALLSAFIAMEKANKSAETVKLSLSMLSSVSFIGSLADNTESRKESFHYFALLPILALGIAGGYYTYINYAGEYYMRASINSSIAGDAQKTYEYQASAIKINPQRDSYHTTFAQTNLLLANSIAGQENLTEEQAQTVRTLVAQAIQSSRVATEVLSPLNVSGWETRGAIYRSLIGVAKDAQDWAARSYNTAVSLDPTNPRLRLDLGGIFFTNENYLEAANLYRQAVQLKPDYANGRYNFAQALIALESYDEAKRELEIVRNLVKDSPEDVEKVASDLKGLDNRIAQVAGASDESQNPGANPQIQGSPITSIEELQAQTTPTVNQEPLSEPGAVNEGVLENSNLGTQNQDQKETDNNN